MNNFGDSKSIRNITYSSSVILKSVGSNYNLKSSNILWTSQTDLQAVSASENLPNVDNLWTILKGNNSSASLGEYVRCSDIISLQHIPTKKLLYANFDRSLLSDYYRVSGIPPGKLNSDNFFQICCLDSSKKYLETYDKFRLKHLNLDGYLECDSSKRYTNENCNGCPVVGHLEVGISDHEKETINSVWIAEPKEIAIYRA